jgi:hypothetical protein
MTNYEQFLSHAAGLMKESAIRQMGSVLSQSKDMISFAPGYPAEDQFPGSTSRTSAVSSSREPTEASCSTDPLAGSARCARPRST